MLGYIIFISMICTLERNFSNLGTYYLGLSVRVICTTIVKGQQKHCRNEFWILKCLLYNVLITDWNQIKVGIFTVQDPFLSVYTGCQFLCPAHECHVDVTCNVTLVHPSVTLWFSHDNQTVRASVYHAVYGLDSLPIYS